MTEEHLDELLQFLRETTPKDGWKQPQMQTQDDGWVPEVTPEEAT